MILVILLVGFCPIVFSSPAPPSSSSASDANDKINYQSNGFPFTPSDSQALAADDASSSAPTVQDSLLRSSPIWYVQPRARANDFLLSHADDNEIVVPTWYRKSHDDDQPSDDNNDDDSDDYVPSAMFFNKRSIKNNHHGGFSNIKKRKPLTKPPMEVMNEIVNSIYLKR